MHRRLLPAVVLGTLLLGIAALLALWSPPSTFPLQAQRGAVVYESTCLACHGGAGGRGVPGRTEPLEGALFQERNPSALEIYDVVRSGREPNLRALSDQQLWDAIAAELAFNGVDLGNRELGIDDAASAASGPNAPAPDPARFFPPGR